MDEFSQNLYDASINEGKFATVKRMLKLGKSSLAEIAEDTDLPLATVQQIQAEMHTA